MDAVAEIVRPDLLLSSTHGSEDKMLRYGVNTSDNSAMMLCCHLYYRLARGVLVNSPQVTGAHRELRNKSDTMDFPHTRLKLP